MAIIKYKNNNAWIEAIDTSSIFTRYVFSEALSSAVATNGTYQFSLTPPEDISTYDVIGAHITSGGAFLPTNYWKTDNTIYIQARNVSGTTVAQNTSFTWIFWLVHRSNIYYRQTIS